MAIEAQGTKIFWSASTAISTAQQVNAVTGFNGPAGSMTVIDITDLGSTAKQKIIGLFDAGQISLDCNYVSTDAGQLALRADMIAKTKRNVAIKLTDSSTQLISADAYCTGFALSGAVDDKIPLSISLELTGGITYSTA